MTHLELLNVVLSWRFEQPGWPPILARAGYFVDAVGVGLLLPNRHHKAVPEAVATCSARGFTVLVEVKSGRNAEDGQLQRMLEVKAADLRDLNHLSIPAPESHRIQVLYVCNAGEVVRIADQVQQDRVAVVGFDGRRYTTMGTIADPVLAAELAAAEVAGGVQPIPVIPFDQDSPSSVMARWVLPELVAALASGGSAISIEGVLTRTHGVVYEVMRPSGSGGGSELKALKRRVGEIINDAMDHEFSAWIERQGSDQAWRFKRSLSHDLSGKTRDLQGLRRAADQMLARLGDTAAGVQLLIPLRGQPT